MVTRLIFPELPIFAILLAARTHMAGNETYIFAGGGSGGHLYPGIAIADELRRRNSSARVLFAGSERPLETAILKPTGYEHRALPVEPLRELRRAPWRFLRRNWSAWRQAFQLLNSEKPRWVIGLGGYISAPTVWAAWRLGMPILLLEQNVIPGAATRWLSRFGRHICLSFEETRRHLRRGLPTVVTGNPVREAIQRLAERKDNPLTLALSPDAGARGPEKKKKTLLILGGSQGAESLNDAVVQTLTELGDTLSGWRIVHQTGPGRAIAIRERYGALAIPAVVEDFFPNVAELYAKADLVISRSGATTLAELACVGCPSILLPYPFAADQHQQANAEVLAERNAAIVIPQAKTADETVLRLKEPLRKLLTDKYVRSEMARHAAELARSDAAQRIVELLMPVDGTLRVPNGPHSENAGYLRRTNQSQELVP